ncbi:glutaredoxin 2 [Budviciaceae bacterium CWB-B4]|uniref:Glutaredoxin 2 n=1 Tax=Limnobaculum xujianqingii TaxID=2738837 RepID=A0A9D7AFX8_9GAMM|nr:glutaredoxin 2 [Limnobaculum xujianqingii]MBK5072037.1 glutaredoxin 2 [Limnobaculum xujianqingii]MBK5175346.1 glutaredoxin 2 [Limnobaculum xujianqingii]
MKLYVYDHCPFCVKARMIFGIKKIPFELVTLLNDDEETPIRMIGQKMAPILEKDDGSYMPESMDIVHYVDETFGTPALTGKTNPAIADWLKQVSPYLNKLLIPRYAQADFCEFRTPSARQYFSHKKEAMIGNFAEALTQTPELVKQLEQDLAQLEKLIQSPGACNGELSVDDIHLFPSIRGISIVKGVKYPPKVDAYRKEMSKISGVNLLDSIAQ